jgi:hypothetical protein
LSRQRQGRENEARFLTRKTPREKHLGKKTWGKTQSVNESNPLVISMEARFQHGKTRQKP